MSGSAEHRRESGSSFAAMNGCRSSQELDRFGQEFIHERLSYWTQHLGLNDWQISIVMTERSALKPKTLGGIRWDKGKKSAVLSVLSASEYRGSVGEIFDDMEFTVVHELVHLGLASLPRSEASRRSEEHAVNRFTEALLKLNRRSDNSKRAVGCSAMNPSGDGASDLLTDKSSPARHRAEQERLRR